jgi:hypothetical protein
MKLRRSSQLELNGFAVLVWGVAVPVAAQETPRPSSAVVLNARQLRGVGEPRGGEAYRSSVDLERKKPIGLPIVILDNTTTIVGGLLLMGFFLILIHYSTRTKFS